MTLYKGLPILSLSGHNVAFNTGLLAQNGRVPGGFQQQAQNQQQMVAPQSMQMAHVVAAPGGSSTMQPVPVQTAQYATAPQYPAVQYVEATAVPDNKY